METDEKLNEKVKITFQFTRNYFMEKRKGKSETHCKCYASCLLGGESLIE